MMTGDGRGIETSERPYKGKAEILRFNSSISNKQENTALHKQRLVKIERNDNKRIRCYLNVTAGRTKLNDNLAVKRGNSKDLQFEEPILIGTEFITLFVDIIAIFTITFTEIIPVCCWYN
jgi:hypothetical protein